MYLQRAKKLYVEHLQYKAFEELRSQLQEIGAAQDFDWLLECILDAAASGEASSKKVYRRDHPHLYPLIDAFRKCEFQVDVSYMNADQIETSIDLPEFEYVKILLSGWNK